MFCVYLPCFLRGFVEVLLCVCVSSFLFIERWRLSTNESSDLSSTAHKDGKCSSLVKGTGGERGLGRLCLISIRGFRCRAH